MLGNIILKRAIRFGFPLRSFGGEFVECSTDDPSQLTENDIGKMFKIDDKFFGYPSALEYEAHKKLLYPYILLTKIRYDIIHEIVRINKSVVNFKSDTIGLVGAAGVGKSLSTYIGAYTAKRIGWLTLYIPNGRELVELEPSELKTSISNFMENLYFDQRDILNGVLVKRQGPIPAVNLGELL